MVASKVLDYYSLGRDLPLESLDLDAYREDSYSELSVSVGAGSGGSLLLFLLVVQVVIAARGARAIPLQEASKIKLKRLP